MDSWEYRILEFAWANLLFGFGVFDQMKVDRSPKEVIGKRSDENQVNKCM